MSRATQERAALDRQEAKRVDSHEGKPSESMRVNHCREE